MSDLAPLVFAQAPPAPDTINALVYGASGAGKSTCAATAPGPILWVNAEGGNALSFARKTAAQRSTNIYEVRVDHGHDPRPVLRAVIDHVRSGADPVPRTVVVDTIGKVRDGLALAIGGRKPTLQQWGDLLVRYQHHVADADVVAYLGVSRSDDGVRYLAQFVQDRGRRAKDRSGGLGTTMPSDFSLWLDRYREALTPDDSDLPFDTEEQS